MVGHEVDDHVNSAAMRFAHEIPEVVIGAVAGIDMIVVDDVVPVIARRFVDRHQPNATRAKAGGAGRIAIVDVVEARRESAQIANPVAVGIVERADEYLVADAGPPPRLAADRDSRSDRRQSGARAFRHHGADQADRDGTEAHRKRAYRLPGSQTATPTRESAVP